MSGSIEAERLTANHILCAMPSSAHRISSCSAYNEEDRGTSSSSWCCCPWPTWTAKAFYTEQAGFNLDVETEPTEGFRIGSDDPSGVGLFGHNRSAL